ncbi:hypothetical protein BpHYR1_045007 [Brachionus plicatilis]|uniref:Uncharacterized protein n=1 Tax=Brachionus plicatilis TaxID=10195 RepID=A0A3M7PVB3_BRAPC|nr:hypothetical protein BpHYR1_045007 [Brachionus plicatilis]
MEFETRIVNGKPSIYYKNDIQKNVIKKVNTKDAKNKKEIKKSMGISGEVDKVKPSPRQNELQTENQLKLIYSVLNQNGVKMSQNQLAAFLEQIQKNEKGSTSNLNKSTEQNNKNNMNYYSDQEQDISFYSSKPKSMLKKKDLMIENIVPQTSSSNQDEYQDHKFLSDNEKTTAFGNRLSLTEKKKIKWQQDKELFEKLNQQENNDALKSVSPRRFYQNNVPNVSQKENFSEVALPSKLSLTEKKKIQWQKEREESEKRELEQRLISHDTKRYPFDFSPERKTSNENYAQRDSKFVGSTKNLEYDHTNNQESVINLLKKSNSLKNLENVQKNAFSAELNQFQQENKLDRAKMNPHLDKEERNNYWPYENNYKNKNSTNHSDQIEEFKRIKQQIDEITAYEKSLKNEEHQLNNISKFDENKTKHDQSRVPPAMRTSISFGVFLKKIYSKAL